MSRETAGWLGLAESGPPAAAAAPPLERVETEVFRLAIASWLSIADLAELRQVSRRMHTLVDDLLPVSDAFRSWNAVRHKRNEPSMLWGSRSKPRPR